MQRTLREVVFKGVPKTSRRPMGDLGVACGPGVRPTGGPGKQLACGETGVW